MANPDSMEPQADSSSAAGAPDQASQPLADNAEISYEARPLTAGEEYVSTFPPIHILPWYAPFTWLKLAWQDFRASPGSSLLYGVFFALMGGGLSLVFEHAPQFLSALACGFLLVGPFLALGLYDISRRREAVLNGQAEIPARGGGLNNIGILAAVLAVVMLVWARASLIVIALFFTQQMPSMEVFLSQAFTPENLQFLGTYLAVGLLFASIVFAISWVSMPMMLDRDSDAITSMIISFGAMGKNMPVAVIWGLIIVASVVFSFATYTLGFIITMPLIGHATWHAYRATVGEESEAVTLEASTDTTAETTTETSH